MEAMVSNSITSCTIRLAFMTREGMDRDSFTGVLVSGSDYPFRAEAIAAGQRIGRSRWASTQAISTLASHKGSFAALTFCAPLDPHGNRETAHGRPSPLVWGVASPAAKPKCR
ncbi:hypothetical protein GCM10023342_28740 [Modicisalibacter zincidurans]|uniref:Uncharacterized protein n=1 Tax=Modicisalibacter zincidurans TaxID=1178777 RepID=A0ABP9RK46_9GAMM